MTTDNGKTNTEAQIRKLIENRVESVRAKDVTGAMSNYAPDVVMFDVVNTLQYVGADAVRKRAEEWFALYPGPIGYEIRDLNVTAGDGVGFCHYLYRVTGTLASEVKVDMWVRATVCCRKTDGKWMITHEHGSVPFYPESGKASLDLKP